MFWASEYFHSCSQVFGSCTQAFQTPQLRKAIKHMLTCGTDDKSCSVLELREGKAAESFTKDPPQQPLAFPKFNRAGSRPLLGHTEAWGSPGRQKETLEHGQILLPLHARFASNTTPVTFLGFSYQKQFQLQLRQRWSRNDRKPDSSELTFPNHPYLHKTSLQLEDLVMVLRQILFTHIWPHSAGPHLAAMIIHMPQKRITMRLMEKLRHDGAGGTVSVKGTHPASQPLSGVPCTSP